MTPRRFPILFTGANRAMAALGLLPSRCRVELADDEVRVRMGWAFRADIPRSAITSAAPDRGLVWGWGAHGWRGRWLVNGSSRNLVRVEIDPPIRAWLLVVVPVRLRTLRVSLTEPAAFVDAIAPASP